MTASLLGNAGSNPLHALATRYLDHALEGRRREASRLVLDALDVGTSLADIYLHVFQPVQREIGRLWQLNQITIAQEHLCTAITQLVMAQLYPRLFVGTRRDLRLVATCLGGELHEIGVRMVADFFEMEGWDTFFLGANTPADEVVGAVVAAEAHLLAVSGTVAARVEGASDLISQVRAEPRCANVRVIVGGQPFNEAPELWRQVGADGTAQDAEQAVALARRLMGY
jgi:methanogenic corrinoid protein MtbC1